MTYAVGMWVRVAEDVLLESGDVLPAGKSVHVFAVAEGALGIQWVDGGSIHSMAISESKIEPC